MMVYEEITLTTKRPKKKDAQAKSEVPTTPEQAQVLLEKLQVSETRYRRLFETAQDGILLLDAKTGEITDVNPFLLDLLGYPYGEIAGKKLWEIGPFANRKLATQAFEKLQKDRYIRYEDLPLETATGVRIHVEFVSNVYPVGGRDVIQCNIREIGRRKLAEEVARGRLIGKDFALDVGGLGAWRLDLASGTAWRSSRHDEIFGYPTLLPEWTYEIFLSHVLAEDRGAVAESFGEALSGKTDWDFTCRIRRKDGEVRWIWVKGTPELGERGEPVALYGLVQDITKYREAEERIKHLNAVLHAIRSVNQIIVREKDQDNLITGICESLTATRGYNNVWIALLDESNKLVNAAEQGLEDDFQPLLDRLRRGELTSCGRKALENPGVIVTEDPLSTCSDCPLSKRYAGWGALAIRLGHDSKVYGMLSCSIPANFIHEKQEQALFQEVAADISFALYSIELEEKQVQAEEMLRVLEQEARGFIETSHDWIWSINLQGRYTYSNPAVEEILGCSPDELVGHSFLTLIHPEDRQDAEAILPQSIEKRQGWRDIVLRWKYKDGNWCWLESTSVPILDAQGAIGGFRGVNRDITERRRMHEALQRSLDGTVQAIGATAERRDPYTAGHQQRVTQLACAIAKQMGLPQDQTEGIRLAGLVHDIGKMSIPAEILSKPSKLAETEYQLIKAHPQVAYDILKPIAFPWPVAEIVLQHHERLDGSGYPCGLKGEAISLGARILAVADVVEAMASHRPYRPALGIDAALAEIRDHQGKLYDSSVVETCVQLFVDGFEFAEAGAEPSQ